jgi:ssDNA-binding Zn-finger/Zn-ribbon topoisomerase 1
VSDQPKTPPLRCPDCGDGQLVERVNKTNGSHFMGCDNYPKCTHTQDVPAFVHMLRQGATQLPGFGE